MKSNQARGSAFDEFFVQEPLTRDMPNDLLADLTGFRLVYDNSERSCRGGDSRDTPLLAQDPGVYWYRPSLRGVGLGFRLVREGT